MGMLHSRAWGMAAALMVVSESSRAALTILSGPQQGTQVGNIVVNGSFENGSPGPGAGNFRLWATGTTVGAPPFAVPPGWTSAGQPATYAVWGSDNPVAPFRVRQSDILPHGQVGMYFGNGAPVTSDQPPTFNTTTGEVTFPNAPNFTIPFGGPARLWQQVDTHLNPSPAYLVSFWASGEGAIGPGSPLEDGIFGFKVTNVLPGDPIQWLTAPSGSTSPLGASHRYEYSFVPLNPLLPVTIEFINPGHFDLTAYGRSGTTELAIDDVIVNLVPEPGSAALIGLMAACAVWRRRGR